MRTHLTVFGSAVQLRRSAAVVEAAQAATPACARRIASWCRLSPEWSAATPRAICTPVFTTVRVISRVSAPRM